MLESGCFRRLAGKSEVSVGAPETLCPKPLISPRNYEDLQSSVDEAGQYHIVTEDVKKAEGGDLINQPANEPPPIPEDLSLP